MNGAAVPARHDVQLSGHGQETFLLSVHLDLSLRRATVGCYKSASRGKRVDLKRRSHIRKSGFWTQKNSADQKSRFGNIH